MARHSHWAQIKLKKGALDKKRGKIFARHAHLIEQAARKAGGDPNTNAGLRMTIESARADNLPRENIDRAIKKGTGELKAEEMFEVMYEGFGPAGIALVVDVLTNNKNRTAQTVRNIFQKHGGNMGGVGATSFLFEVKGMIEVKKKAPVAALSASGEDEALALIEAGAEDFEEVEAGYVLYTAANELGEVRKKVEAASFSVTSAQLTKIAKNFVTLSDPQEVEKVMSLMEALEDEEDVSGVAANFSVDL